MFGFLKKGITPLQIAAFLSKEPSKYISDIDLVNNQFIENAPQFAFLKNKIIDEIQWIIIGSGVIAVHAISGITIAKEVIKQIIVIHTSMTTGPKKQSLPPAEVAAIATRMDKYLTRFNRGVALRLESNHPRNLIFDDAIKDVANESMEFITGTKRCQQVSIDNIDSLQERTVAEDELERYMFKVARQFIYQLKKHFKETKISA